MHKQLREPDLRIKTGSAAWSRLSPEQKRAVRDARDRAVEAQLVAEEQAERFGQSGWSRMVKTLLQEKHR